MSRLADIYRQRRPAISFELFPPKTAQAEEELFRHVGELVKLEPSFITCTYGAGGSTREKTLAVVSQVRQRYGCPVAAHLTCVGSSVDQLREYLHQACQCGVDFIVALRGDPPRGETNFAPAPGGLRYANELVALIRREFSRFGIAVAGYPETHQEAPSPEADLENLKRKVLAGADAVLTQLFYDNDDFFRFRDRYDRLNIPAPLVPGILPITNLAQVQRITALCGARLPARLVEMLQHHGDDPAGQFEVGVQWATQQVHGLLQAGVPGVHFYVLNKSQAAVRVLQQVGTAPNQR